MAKRCIRCANCERADGAPRCRRDGEAVTDESRARFDGGKCWERIVPRKKTRDEILALKSKAGKIGAAVKRNGRPKVPQVQMRVDMMDRDVLECYARKNCTTLVSSFHHLCRVILQNHPDIKKPDGWVD